MFANLQLQGDNYFITTQKKRTVQVFREVLMLKVLPVAFGILCWTAKHPPWNASDLVWTAGSEIKYYFSFNLLRNMLFALYLGSFEAQAWTAVCPGWTSGSPSLSLK